MTYYRLSVPSTGDKLTGDAFAVLGQTQALWMLCRLGFAFRDLFRVTDPTDAHRDIYYCGAHQIATGHYVK